VPGGADCSRTSSGVLVHIHDVFFPFDYPAAWIVTENRSWNEAYMLRAFLLFNEVFRVFYFSDWISATASCSPNSCRCVCSIAAGACGSGSNASEVFELKPARRGIP
jgi:hypothetical protein